MLKKLKGQSTLEYALIIAVVVGALLAMDIYVKRGVQGKLRQATDDIGQQFEAENTTGSHTITRTGSDVQTTKSGGVVETVTTADTRSETGNETVAAWSTP